MLRLKHPYPSVAWSPNGSFGGNQSRSDSRIIRKCGCGAVALTDLALYLTRYHGCSAPDYVRNASDHDPIPPELYDDCCRKLQRKYLPTVPPFGTSPPVLLAAAELYCRIHNLPFRAKWNTSADRLFLRMEQMLRQDLPVIVAIGANLPPTPTVHKVNFYRKRGDGYTAVTAACAHFVTVTGLDEQWMEISSWGKVYYLDRQEFLQYGREHSLFAVHNILYLEPL